MVIRLAKVKNIRDLSEYGLPDCIRSAHLHAATPKDMETLYRRYGLRTIIDLRTTREVEEKPDAVFPGVNWIHIPIFDEAVPGLAHEDETDRPDKLGPRMPDMTELYAALAGEAHCVAQLKKVLAVVNDPRREGAVLWHCTEGKDRCGVTSALFLLSHGVAPEAVMTDYLRTNRVNFFKAWRLWLLILLSGRGRTLAKQVRSAFLAKREYLAPVMDTLAQLAQTPEG